MAETKNTCKGIPKTRLDYSDPMLLLEVEGLARDGFDDQQIAEILNVAPVTFSRHKTSKKVDGSESELSQALKRGRRPLSVLVENSLYKRAIGLKVITTKVITKREFNHELGHFETNIYDETITTELPGDVAAQGLWLKCHKSDIYNIQPVKVDVTSQGEKIKSEAPKITIIEHVTISDAKINKSSDEADFSSVTPSGLRIG